MRVIRGIKVASGEGWTVIEVHLDGRFRYLSHTPSGTSETLQIRLRAESPMDIPSELAEGQVLVWRARDLVPLIDIHVDLDARGDPGLFLNFERPLEFRVAQPSSLERLRISLREPPGARTARSDRIMAEGRKAMTAGDFSRAAMLFTKVLGKPEDPRAPEARELLGLAYQRAGRLAHARAEYEEYLASYPEAEGVARVAQRLQALQTARTRGQRRVERTERASASFEHSFFGGFAQFYRWGTVDTEVTGSETISSSLDADVFLGSRHSKGSFSARTNFSGSYRYDLLDQLDSEDAMRVSSAFIDVSSRRSVYSARLGRQSASGGGVLGRFDGIKVWREISERLRLSLVSGFPVEFSDSNRINSQRFFYGTSADFGPFLERWDVQLFAIRQELHGVEDRSAIGGQIRYTGGQSFALALVDYDVSYSALNTLMFISNWRLGESTNISVSADRRKSPILTTRNAIQGQPVEDFDDLEALFDEEQIRDLAEDRTADSSTATLGISHRFSSGWQIAGDVSVSNLSDTPASGVVPATPGTDNEYNFSLRATGTDLIVDGSFTTFGLRFANADTNDRYSATIAARYTLLDGLRLGPRVSLELRRNDGSADQWKLRPLLRLDYRWRAFQFELDGGVDIERGTANDNDADETEYFVNVGGRYDF